MKLFSIAISVFLMFNVTLLYFSFISGISSIIPFSAAIVASIATIISAFYGSRRLVNFLAFFVALELGCSFPVLLQTPLNYIVPAVYTVFDLYAIYYGRMGRLVKQVAEGTKSEEARLQENTTQYQEIEAWWMAGIRTIDCQFSPYRDRDGRHRILHNGTCYRSSPG